MKFKIRKLTKKQETLKQNLIEAGYEPIIAHAFALRNYTYFEECYPVDLLDGMNIAVDYLVPKLIHQEEICVVADYDADGATSCAIMVKGLRMLGQKDNVKYFIPDRMKHGYGLQPSVIDDMLNSYPNIKTIITVDNGISAIAGVNYAKEKGIDVVITDHHIEGDTRPNNAVCILNPNKKDCKFPSKALAGCGVAFYLIKALRDKFKLLNNEENLGKYNLEQQQIIKIAAQAPIAKLMDYLAIGTVADLVPLDNNNRLLVQYGIKRIRTNHSCVGVQAMLAALGFNESNVHKFSTADIAFKFAPSLNAIGRLDNMTSGVDLLLSEDFSEAIHYAINAIEFNKERKLIERTMVDSATEEMERNIVKEAQKDNHFSCALIVPNGHEGVVGIVASRIKEKLYIPTILFVEIEETHNGKELIKGSGRSIDGLHIRDAIAYVCSKSPDCVVKYGGHAMAAGLTIVKDKLPDFQKYFEEYCRTIFSEKPSMEHLVDDNLDLSTVSVNDIYQLNSEIWGQGFTTPIYYGKFTIQSQKILNDKQTGKPAHLKMLLEQKDTGITVDSIWFRHNKMFINHEIELVYQLQVNDFLGNQTMQLLVQDGMECE